MTQTQTQQELGRAKNTLQDYMIRKLVVPKVYFDAEWDGKLVDVLAIDRAGVGDVHAVRMFAADYEKEKYISTLRGYVKEFRSHRSHYRYVAVVNDSAGMPKIHPEESTFRDSFAEDGVGRVGILYVDLSDDDP